jgi:hypothetical protein
MSENIVWIKIWKIYETGIGNAICTFFKTGWNNQENVRKVRYENKK